MHVCMRVKKCIYECKKNKKTINKIFKFENKLQKLNNDNM